MTNVPMQTYKNLTGSHVRFEVGTTPGAPSIVYEVEAGGHIAGPVNYAECFAREGLQPAPDVPVAAVGKPRVKEPGPTIEQWVGAEYFARDYPPSGYDEVPSPGLDAYRAGTWDPDALIERPPVDGVVVPADPVPAADSKPESADEGDRAGTLEVQDGPDVADEGDTAPQGDESESDGAEGEAKKDPAQAESATQAVDDATHEAQARAGQLGLIDPPADDVVGSKAVDDAPPEPEPKPKKSGRGRRKKGR